MKFELPRHIELAQLPTPIVKLERMSQILEGPQIYVKRDDLTGIASSGNKIRKLEFLMAEAMDKKCDSVITCGGSQSNHARSTAVAAAKLGLKCYLLLRNNLGTGLEGNLFLNSLVGADVRYVSPEEYARIEDLMQNLADDLRGKGLRPYLIPEGGSNELGAMGYVRAAQEIFTQLGQMKLIVDHIVVTVGSGGTYAGLLMGKFLYDSSAMISGINICDSEAYFVNRIYEIVQKAQKRFNMKLNIPKKEIRIIDGYVGKGYGLSSLGEIKMIKKVARAEGVILDPVYTGKAMLGLADQIQKKKIAPDQNVLFIHTGGLFGIFSKKSLFF